MKFKYDKKNDYSKCVAVIGYGDALVVKTDEGCTYLYTSEYTPNHANIGDWDAEVERSTHKFYPGDKITITF